VAINPDQIGLVAADNRTRANHRYKFRAIGASSTGLRYSFAARTVGDRNQLPAGLGKYYVGPVGPDGAVGAVNQ